GDHSRRRYGNSQYERERERRREEGTISLESGCHENAKDPWAESPKREIRVLPLGRERERYKIELIQSTE
ncbi:unnamed protein product, partial [Dovyalis caffra]